LNGTLFAEIIARHDDSQIFIARTKADIPNMSSMPFYSRFILTLAALLASVSGSSMYAQYRPAGGAAGNTTGDIGRITIELPVKTPVYTATAQLYLGDQQVATRSLKKDSVADKARIVDIRNLKEGLYTIKIESPGMPDMLQQVYVRNEKDPVRVYIDYPESVRQVSPSGGGTGGMNELLLRIEQLERRIEYLELKGGKTTSNRSSRRSAPARVQQTQPPVEDLAPPVTTQRGKKPKKATPVQQTPVEEVPDSEN
jgi:hypothetical protein